MIPDDEMAELMADIHTAESVVDTERRVFATDSMRRLLKQSVLARYGYTMADFDSRSPTTDATSTYMPSYTKM